MFLVEEDMLTPRVQEAEGRLSGLEASVVEESDDGGEDGGCGRGAARELGFAVDDYSITVRDSIVSSGTYIQISPVARKGEIRDEQASRGDLTQGASYAPKHPDIRDC